MLFRVSHEDGTAGNPQEAGAKTACDGAEKNQPVLTGAVNKVHASSIWGISKSADLLVRQSAMLILCKKVRSEHTASVHLGVRRLQRTPTKGEKMAMTPNTTALAALAISGLAPPPAPIPLRAPKIPGQVKAVAATMKAEKMVPRYQVTGCFWGGSDIVTAARYRAVLVFERGGVLQTAADG